MPKIIVMNMGTEQMFGQHLTRTHHLLAAKSAWRNAWFAAEADLIISPVPIESTFLGYIGTTLGFDPTSVSVITPYNNTSDQLTLTDELLLSPSVIGALRERIAHSDTWKMLPCFYTEGVAELGSRLGIEDPGQYFAAQRGADLLNRKTHFRQLAVGAGLPLAQGSIAHMDKRCQEP
jgi:hypothetical protein